MPFSFVHLLNSLNRFFYFSRFLSHSLFFQQSLSFFIEFSPFSHPPLSPGSLPSLSPVSLPSLVCLSPGSLPSLSPVSLPSLSPGSLPSLSRLSPVSLHYNPLPSLPKKKKTLFSLSFSRSMSLFLPLLFYMSLFNSLVVSASYSNASKFFCTFFPLDEILLRLLGLHYMT